MTNIPESATTQDKTDGKDRLHGSLGQNVSQVSVARIDWEYHHSLFVKGWKCRKLYAAHIVNLWCNFVKTIMFYIQRKLLYNRTVHYLVGHI